MLATPGSPSSLGLLLRWAFGATTYQSHPAPRTTRDTISSQRCGPNHRPHAMREDIGLDQAPLGIACVVKEVHMPFGADWRQRLQELGFLPGEPVMVMARAAPGGQPLAVRVGQSLFALRREEAACVRVRPAAENAQ